MNEHNHILAEDFKVYGAFEPKNKSSILQSIEKVVCHVLAINIVGIIALSLVIVEGL